jgi:N-acetylneuraminic acid mutarotase
MPFFIHNIRTAGPVNREVKLISLLPLLVSTLNAQMWRQLGDYPGLQRDDGVSALVNNKVYCGTGLMQWWVPSGQFFALDLDTYHWDTLRSMPPGAERQYACTFTTTNAFYVFGGDQGGALNDLFIYNTITNKWTGAAAKPGHGLIGASCLQFGDAVIIAGGKTAAEGPLSKEVWQYTISADVWTKKKDFPFLPRFRASAGVLDGKGYFMFGKDDSSAYRKEIFSYELPTDTWKQLADFPQGDGRAYCPMEVSADKIILVGGHAEHNEYLNDVWYYDGQTDSWSPGPAFPGVARRGVMSCLAGDRFIMTCGLGNGDVRLKDTWMMDVPSALEDAQLISNITVFPQPARDFLAVQFRGSAFNAVVHIKDLSSRVIYSENISAGTFHLSLGGISAGVYILEINEAGKNLARKKIIKE